MGGLVRGLSRFSPRSSGDVLEIAPGLPSCFFVTRAGANKPQLRSAGTDLVGPFLCSGGAVSQVEDQVQGECGALFKEPWSWRDDSRARCSEREKRSSLR